MQGDKALMGGGLTMECHHGESLMVGPNFDI